MRIAAAAAAALLALLPAGAATARDHAPAHPEAGKTRSEHRPSQLDLAAKGNAEAQYQVGMATLHGLGHARNPRARDKQMAQGLMWLGLAAYNGNAAAAGAGARMFELTDNFAEAARWWHRAGELGDAEARGRFVESYLDGRTADLGGNAGAEWLAMRAATADIHAELALGEALEKGRGVAVDPGRAQHWYLEAALDGNTEAMFRLGRLQIHLPAVWRTPAKETGRDGKWMGPVTYPLVLGGHDRDGGEPDLGRSAVAAANNLDRGDLTFSRPGMVEGEQWLKRAARHGHAGAQYALARAYLRGIDLPPDIVDAVRWLQAAAWQGNPAALLTLGDLAATGTGFPAKDPVRAWVCDDLAAQQGAAGAESARDQVAKAMPPRQLARARQIAQDLRDLGGM